MILSVHAIFGAATASLVPSHPVEAFAVGFVSHFIIDAIPHKDYELISIEKDSKGKLTPIDIICKKFKLIRDMLLVSFDAFVGLCLAFMFFFDTAHPWIFFLGAVGSMLPDFLTFLYLIVKHKSLDVFYNFHSSLIHSKIVLNFSQVVGVFVQYCTVIVLIAVIYWLKCFFYS
jgi:hypothetical protein